MFSEEELQFKVSVVAEILATHLPASSNPQYCDVTCAGLLVGNLRSPSGMVSSYKKQDLENLESIFAAISKLKNSYTHLHVDLRFRLNAIESEMVGSPVFENSLSRCVELIEHAAPILREEISGREGAGNRKLISASVFQDARYIWATRTGKSAPTAEFAPGATPFALYVEDVFDALGCGNAVAAQRLWSKDPHFHKI